MKKNNNYFIDERTGEKISYISCQEINENGLINNALLIGEKVLGEKIEANNKSLKKIKESDIEIEILPIGSFKEKKYKTIGYIPCDHDEYIVLKRKKTFHWIKYILFLLLIICAFVGGWFYMNQSNPDIDPNAFDYNSALKRPANIEDSDILIPGYGKFTIMKGSNVIDTVLFNPEDNPCFFQFTLIEAATNDILYESKLVPPGQGISPIKLTKTFDEVGQYEVILKFKTVDFEDTNITYNGSEMEVELNVVE